MSNNQYKTFWVIIPIALIIILLIIINWPIGTNKNVPPLDRPIKTAYIPLTANLPLFVAMEKGFFQKNGIRVEAVEVSNPNDLATAIVSNKIDFATVMAYTIIFPSALEHPNAFKLFHSTEEDEKNYTASIVVKKDSTLKTIDDLRGKKVGVYGGLVQTNFLKAILVGAGIKLSEVKIVEINPRLQIQGLLAGEFEALSTTEPTSNVATAKGNARLLVENPRVKYIMNPFPSTATVVGTAFLSEHPVETRAILKSLDEAVDFIKQNPTEAKRFLLKYTPIPSEVESQVLNDLKLLHYLKPGEENVKSVQRLADYLYDNKIVGNKLNVNELFGARP